MSKSGGRSELSGSEDSGVASSINSATSSGYSTPVSQWSSSGHQYGYFSAAHSTCSDSGVFSGRASTDVQGATQNTKEWVEKHFEVLVKKLDGTMLTIPVERDEDVAEFRAKVDRKTGVPGSQQYLISAEGRKLEDGKRLCDYNIKKHSTIYCQGRLRGGNTFVENGCHPLSI